MILPSHDKNLKFKFKIKKILLTNKEVKTETWSKYTPPRTKWEYFTLILLKLNKKSIVVVVVYHVTIVAIGHGLLKKFWPMVTGCVLRTAGSSLI